MLSDPFRVPLAREHLRQRIVTNAGVDPNSGYWLGSDASDYANETNEDRASGIEYLHRLNQAVSHIAGLIEGCHIRVWRDRDGRFELAPPVSTAQAFYQRNGEMDDLYFERSEWQAVFETYYPETDLARWHQSGAPSAEMPVHVLPRRVHRLPVPHLENWQAIG